MELNDLESQRVEKLERLQAAGIPPYPHRSHRTHTVQQAIQAYQETAASTRLLWLQSFVIWISHWKGMALLSLPITLRVWGTTKS